MANVRVDGGEIAALSAMLGWLLGLYPGNPDHRGDRRKGRWMCIMMR